MMFVLAMVGMALAIPMVCVVLAYKAYSTPRQPDLPPEALAPLQKALEDVATKQLAQPAQLSSGTSILEISASSNEAGMASIERTASDLGGFVLPKAEPDKVLVQIPTERSEVFAKSLKGENVESMSKSTTGGDTALIEVHITIIPPKP
ncbi:hypothetical protein [Terrimicrobium sacchariphilum]|nr:hypothetical protein [Terrimicrobium sacchariphilum]